jgi:hypothetical protein
VSILTTQDIVVLYSNEGLAEGVFMENEFICITQFDKLKYLSEVFCSKCQTVWMASGSHGMLGLECPVCQEQSGRVLMEHKPSDAEEEFNCNCGSKLFLIKRFKGYQASVYCRYCGIEAVGWF